MKKVRVLELFAGVGGFRLGLDAASSEKFKYETVWASQWEPSTLKQHAAEIYAARFGEDSISNENIEQRLSLARLSDIRKNTFQVWAICRLFHFVNKGTTIFCVFKIFIHF